MWVSTQTWGSLQGRPIIALAQNPALQKRAQGEQPLRWKQCKCFSLNTCLFGDVPKPPSNLLVGNSCQSLKCSLLAGSDLLACRALRCSADWSPVQFCTVVLEFCEYKWASAAPEPRAFQLRELAVPGARGAAANTPENPALKLVCIVPKQFSLLLWKITVHLVCLEKGFSISRFTDPKKRSSESTGESHSLECENLLFLNPFRKVSRNLRRSIDHRSKKFVV